ncbi:MAG: hypothetical protein QOK64_09020, partial [Nitrososphaeraceae archaeon]|nr:hypothetical protein [Nitrososphaeraceae archaeon]
IVKAWLFVPISESKFRTDNGVVPTNSNLQISKGKLKSYVICKYIGSNNRTNFIARSDVLSLN